MSNRSLRLDRCPSDELEGQLGRLMLNDYPKLEEEP